MGTHSLSPTACALAAGVVTSSPVGIVTALASEASALGSRRLRVRTALALDSGDTLWLSGMGPHAAREGALALIEAGATALLSFGVAGALAPGLRSGTLLCPHCVLDEHGRDFQPDAVWRTSLLRRLADAGTAPVAEGSLLSVSTPLLSAADKSAMRERHQALAVDMESAAIAAVGREHGLPFLALRAIVDERDDLIPGDLHDGIDAWGRPHALRLTAALLRRPHLLAALLKLAMRMGKATRALRRAARSAGAQWGRETSRPC